MRLQARLRLRPLTSALDLVAEVANLLADLAARLAEAVLDVTGIALIQSFIHELGITGCAPDARLDLAGGLIRTTTNFILVSHAHVQAPPAHFSLQAARRAMGRDAPSLRAGRPRSTGIRLRGLPARHPRSASSAP